MAVLKILISCCLLAGMIQCLNTELNSSKSLKRRKSRSYYDDDELSNRLFKWACPYLSESDPWYRFLNSLYCKFSEYEIQVVKSRYNVADIENWGDPAADLDPLSEKSQKIEQGIEINRHNFERFLDKIEEYNIEALDSFRNISSTDLQLKELNHILNITIKQGIQITCKKPAMFIKGDYIVISHISLYIFGGLADDSCKGLIFTNKLRFLNIFALNTVFIDADMPSPGTREPIVIISPKWHIIGSRKINFNGRHGKLEINRMLPSIHHGADGKPGKPGEPGGNFFGIGEEFVNGANLIISANGGDGSAGENGEDGRNGIDGGTPAVPSSSISCRDDLCDDNKQISFSKCEIVSCKYIQGFGGRIIDRCEYKMFGDSGTAGGNGGNGGKGGKGGNPGNIALFELNSYSGISKVSNFGQDGADGEGGRGGIGGRTGNGLRVRCTRNTFTVDWTKVYTIHTTERAPSARNGLRGANSKEIETPIAAKNISNLDRAKIINQYKSYLRENLSDRFKSYFLTNFLNKLENNEKVKNVYDTLGFIDELQSLEEHFYKLNEDVDLLPFYQSLLNRISEYGQNPSEIANPNLIKKVLGYLYTTTLSRVYNLEDDLESNLIVDISAYLESVKNDIEKLKDLQNGKIKEDVINKYKEVYKREIDEKIKKTIDIIAKDITPEIENIGLQTDEQVELLITEVARLQQQTKVEHEELIQKKHQLENALILQDLISSFKIFGSVISFVGPVGAVAGSVIAIGGTIAETFIFNTPGHLNSTVPLTQSVSDLESLKGKIKAIRDQKIDGLKTTMDTISQEAKKHPDAFADITVKVSDYRSRLDEISGSRIKSHHLKDIQNLEIELKATLQTKRSELLNTEGGTTEEKTKNEFVTIQNMQKTVQLSSEALGAYNKHHFHQAKLDTIKNTIKENEDKFYKLKEFQNKIYNSIVPMLQNMQNDIDGIVSNLGKKSKVALDVGKWKVKSTLEDVMTQMQQLTKDFKIQDDLVRCIEKMKDAIVALIDVHDHIQDFQKDQTIANFIADINSITVVNTHAAYNRILENNLRHALNELEITLRSSIVTQRHKVAIDAFKQFVFPFADIYFKELMLPTHLKLDDSTNGVTLENLAFKAVTEMDKIKSKLEEYKQTVRTRDGCIGSGVFNSDFVSSEPFFVWENKEYKNMISNLLSGQTVTIRADITDSQYDAVKFNVINFEFKLKDKTRQHEIYFALRGFRINATHLGNSYYRYDNNMYVMTTPSRAIWYYLEKNYDGEPLHKSSSYDKIKNGDFMLSPYASWQLRLIKVRNHVSFTNLEVYKDEIDLELGGYGHYVNKGNWYCSNLEMGKYYKAINPY